MVIVAIICKCEALVRHGYLRYDCALNKCGLLVFVDLTYARFASLLTVASGWTRNGFRSKTTTRSQPRAELRHVGIVVKSAVIAPDSKRLWTNGLLCSGLCGVLKKINEESAELILMACAQDSDCVILGAADPICHVTLALELLNTSFESMADVFRNRTHTADNINTLGAHLAVFRAAEQAFAK